MKDVEYFTFTMPPSIWSKKPSPSSFKMDVEYATRVFPGATPILSTREVRSLPSTPEELANAGRTNSSGLNTVAMTEDQIGKNLREYSERMRKQLGGKG